ncbi:MAG: hypothetical protein IPI69_03240 [Bacteroidales bacterium]|nr:hypothetical protein [Bacteroidales bacterium]
MDSRNESGDIVSPGAMGVTNSALERLVAELATLQQQKSKLKLNISEDLPAVAAFDKSIMDVKALIAENINSSMNNIENAINEADHRISLVEAELSRLPGTERRLINIQRKFDLNNTVYTYLLEKKAEAGIAKASNVSDNRIIDYATTFNSSRISPKPRKNYLMALTLGLLIPALLILLIDLLNTKVIDKKDIEKVTKAPILGFIGHNSLRTEIPVVEKPGSTLSESFSGQSSFESIIHETIVENLWFAPSGPVPPNPAELVDSPAMKEFIARARKQFDYIIIDTPPVAIVTDALLVSPLTDFYLFIVRQRHTTKNTLGLIEELHRNENIKSLGIVINDISASGYYGYGLRMDIQVVMATIMVITITGIAGMVDMDIQMKLRSIIQMIS